MPKAETVRPVLPNEAVSGEEAATQTASGDAGVIERTFVSACWPGYPGLVWECRKQTALICGTCR